MFSEHADESSGESVTIVTGEKAFSKPNNNLEEQAFSWSAASIW